MSSDMHIYAVPGEAETTICSEHLRPEYTVEMPEPNPDPEIYIASHDGTWIIKDYRIARRVSILKGWPIHEQLEALSEAADGRPEKLESLKKYIHDTKIAFPKQ